jgi:hypothetical protein
MISFYIYCIKERKSFLKMCIPSCFVHLTKTTGKDSKERRVFSPGDKCSQCKAVLIEPNWVAAHVVSYPCCVPCCGVSTLKTSCKKCNNTTNSTSCAGRWYCGFYWCLNRPYLNCVCYPNCLNKDYTEIM